MSANGYYQFPFPDQTQAFAQVTHAAALEQENRKRSLSLKETLRESKLKHYKTRSGIWRSSSKVVPTHNPTSLSRGSLTLIPVESEEVVVVVVADVVVEREQ